MSDFCDSFNPYFQYLPSNVGVWFAGNNYTNFVYIHFLLSCGSKHRVLWVPICRHMSCLGWYCPTPQMEINRPMGTQILIFLICFGLRPSGSALLTLTWYTYVCTCLSGRFFCRSWWSDQIQGVFITDEGTQLGVFWANDMVKSTQF